MTDDATPAKLNDLVEARYRLTLEEQRLMLYLASQIRPEDEDFKVYTLSVQDFLSLFNIRNQSVYSRFKAMSEHLLNKPLVIRKENATLMMNWVSSAEYHNGQGRIELSFDPKLKPYLLTLKDNFASGRSKSVVTLKSLYAIRLYELLRQYGGLTRQTLTLGELRTYLGVDKDAYPLYSNFKQKVLLVAYQELKDKSDLYFEYEEIKVGRKVAKIAFTPHKKAGVPEAVRERDAGAGQPVIQPEIQQDMAALRALIALPLSDRELLSIYEVAGGDISLIEKRYEEAKSRRQLENFVGFMIWSCRGSLG